ncbi:MAG: LptF/LptG family permease, partial [Kiritimatiellia bacterium]
MRLIDKYILREHLLIALYCLITFLALQVLFDVFARFANLVAAEPSLLLLLRYYLGRVAPSFQFLLPATLLFSTVYTLWNMARHGELTAMRASGIGLFRLVGPLLGVALVAVGMVAAVNEFVVPTVGAWAAEFARRGFQWKSGRVQLNHAYYNAAARRSWLISRLDADYPQLL